MAEFFQNCWGYQIWTCGFMWFQVGEQFLDAGGRYSDILPCSRNSAALFGSLSSAIHSCNSVNTLLGFVLCQIPSRNPCALMCKHNASSVMLCSLHFSVGLWHACVLV